MAATIPAEAMIASNLQRGSNLANGESLDAKCWTFDIRVWIRFSPMLAKSFHH
jgi:hypothetical protein